MADDYEVPESEQVDYKKKRQQMILLEGSIHKIKVDFNIKVNDLRIRKQDIISKVKGLYETVEKINGELGTPEQLVLPQIDEKVDSSRFEAIGHTSVHNYSYSMVARSRFRPSHLYPSGAAEIMGAVVVARQSE